MSVSKRASNPLPPRRITAPILIVSILLGLLLAPVFERLLESWMPARRLAHSSKLAAGACDRSGTEVAPQRADRTPDKLFLVGQPEHPEFPEQSKETVSRLDVVGYLGAKFFRAGEFFFGTQSFPKTQFYAAR